MIKINSKNIDLALEKHTEACLNWINKRIKNCSMALNNSVNNKYSSRIEKLNPKQKEKLKNLLVFLSDQNLKKLFTIKTTDINSFINKNKLQAYTSFFSNKKSKEIIDFIFNYDQFKKKGFKLNNNKYWNAYDLVKSLNITVCPYCNRNYVFTATKTRAELDHFYPKSKYPLFQLSFYNLIPSCHICNHSKSNNEKNNLQSPYVDGLVEKFKFVYKPQDVNSLYGHGNNHEVILSPKKKDYEEIINAHNETFHLDELYSYYGDIIQELILKKRVASKEYFGTIKKLFESISDKELKRLAFGNYLDKEDFCKRPLSKLTYDVAIELKLIEEKKQ